jgi:hypothetical protein
MNKQDLIQAKKTIEMLCGISEQIHTDIIYNQGLGWLNRCFANVPAVGTKWSASMTYWVWWRQQWDMRNYELIMKLGFDLEEKGIITADHQSVILVEFGDHHKSADKIYPGTTLVCKIRKEYQEVR